MKLRKQTQNMAKTRLQRNRAKFVEGWIGGNKSSWFTCSVKLFLSKVNLKLNLSSIGTDTLKNLLRVRFALKKGVSVGELESIAAATMSSTSSSSILCFLFKTLKSYLT